jgi:hypothetical protein
MDESGSRETTGSFMPWEPIRDRPSLEYDINGFMLFDTAGYCVSCSQNRSFVKIQLAGLIDLSFNDGWDDGDDVHSS